MEANTCERVYSLIIKGHFIILFSFVIYQSASSNSQSLSNHIVSFYFLLFRARHLIRQAYPITMIIFIFFIVQSASSNSSNISNHIVSFYFPIVQSVSSDSSNVSNHIVSFYFSIVQSASSDSLNVSNHIDSEQSAVNKEDYKDPTGELLEKTTYLLRYFIHLFVYIAFHSGSSVFGTSRAQGELIKCLFLQIVY